MTASVAIHAEGLTKAFGGRVAVDRVDLEVLAGEIFGLIGPNGAGKTTLIRLLCGIQRADSGSAHVLGRDVDVGREAIRQRIGYMSQSFSLYAELTVAENLKFFGDLYGQVSAGRPADVCREVGLGEDDLHIPVAGLATGVRQRAALAAAVLHRPSLVFLDEPTSGVDPAGRRDFWALMRGLTETGTTIVVTTHVMAEAERCDRVALMADGGILACGRPAALRAATGTVVAMIDADPWQRAYALLRDRWPATTLRGRTVHVPVPAGTDLRRELAPVLAGTVLARIELAEPTFEDAFAWFIKQAQPEREHRR